MGRRRSEEGADGAVRSVFVSASTPRTAGTAQIVDAGERCRDNLAPPPFPPDTHLSGSQPRCWGATLCSNSTDVLS